MKNKLRDYEIQTRLGSGSYGVIFKALNKINKQQCVLKQIRMNKMSEKAKKSTLNEATIMGKLVHPFIVQYKQSFIEDDTLHIVMQYCDNGDLSMYLKMQNKKPLKEEKVWKFFLQICLGLEYIHKNKILHRDIKSLNIFLNKNEDVKIGDLGVAKMLMANDFAQTVVGTPFYLSPELCEQKPYNQKSDIWALGCLLYELCTFKHPFEAANQASLILKIIRGKYSPIPQFYSRELKDVIDMCLQRDYKRRPTASMILQRSKIRQYINEFKLEEKINGEYEKMKAMKEINKKLTSVHQPLILKPSIDKKILNQPVLDKNAVVKKQASCNKDPSLDNQEKKASIDKKPQFQPHFLPEKKPSISGMPENNIFLPDRNNVMERLKPNNVVLAKKDLKPNVSNSKNQQSQKNIKQNKQNFIKNLEKAIQHNLVQQKSPFKQKHKQIQEIPTSAVVQHQSRLQKIDMKIQEQLQREKQIQKQKFLNDRKKSQGPNVLVSPKVQEKPNIKQVHKSVPYLIPKDNSRQMGKHQIKLNQHPLIPPLPPKNKQQIIKVKMQQPLVQPKVLEINKSYQQKSKGVIKSKGFTQQIQQQNFSSKANARKISDLKRSSVQNIGKPVLFGLDQQEKQKKQNKQPQKKPTNQVLPKDAHYHSQRNIKIIPQIPTNVSRIIPKRQPQRYVFKKKPQASNVGVSRVRKGGSNSSDLSRNAKNVSKYSEVTKQDEDDVMNLPDSLKNNNQDSSDEEANNKQIKISKNFMLKDINNEIVLQKYEQILSSRSIANSGEKNTLDKEGSRISIKQSQKQQNNAKVKVKDIHNPKNQLKQSNKYFYHQQKVLDGEIDEMLTAVQKNIAKPLQKLEQILQNQSLALKTHQIDEQNDQILDQSQEMIQCDQKEIQNLKNIDEQIYEVNNFNFQEEEEAFQESQNQQQKPKTIKQDANEWSFNEEPELPMLEDKESPFFEQANPYLLVQQQEDSLEQKRNYLQIRLQQNLKRQDQINKLMQIKIEQCKSTVPKYFDEILEFFRKKINKQDEYTENDQREVEEFLRKKGLTDQRKFQNIYKIMHFEMELENTRKIIQRICKKLSQLNNLAEND